MNWSAGDEGYIVEGEFAGTRARVWEVKAGENKAVVSLCVFRENEPFEVDLSALRPCSTHRSYARSLLLVVFIVALGPTLLIGWLLVEGWIDGVGTTNLFSSAVVPWLVQLPLLVAVPAAAYVAFRVLTD